MTLILIAMNDRFALQVSDRRLTCISNVVDEEHNKSFFLGMPGFRFTVAFTGLALIGDFQTAFWLQDRLVEIGKTESVPSRAFERLTTALNHYFNSNYNISRLPPILRRLDVSIVGYNDTIYPPLALAGDISNIGDPVGPFIASFTAETRPNTEPCNWVGAFGNGAALASAHVEQIRGALKRNISPEGMQAILENRIRQIADDPRSGNTIGKQLDYILIYSDSSKAVIAGRSSAVVKSNVVMPAMVQIGLNGQCVRIRQIEVRQEGSNAPMSVPKVHRNQPCLCGSGKKFRNCHGK